MSNYTQITDFGPKDALSTGNAAKKIVGAEFDAEFAAIETAIASKLDANASVSAGQVPQAAVTQHQAALAIAETQITDGSVLARLAANETVTGAWTASGNWTVSGTWTYSGIPAFNGGTSGASAPFSVDSTYVVTNLNADLLDGQEGSYYTNAGNLSGSLADARLSSNIPRYDGSGTFSGTLTYSGAVTFNSAPTKSSEGKFVYLKGSGNTGGAITLSTSDPTGTPANGDLWFKYTA